MSQLSVQKDVSIVAHGVSTDIILAAPLGVTNRGSETTTQYRFPEPLGASTLIVGQWVLGTVSKDDRDT